MSALVPAHAPSAIRYPLGETAWIDLWPGWLAQSEEHWHQQLAEEILWREERYQMFGREMVAPRKVAWHGDTDAHYRYSGVSHQPLPWTPGLQVLRSMLETTTGLHFNSVLANLYRDGSDGMGWHADNEAEVGPTPQDRHIASVSLGTPRRFVLRNERDRSKHTFLLGKGDLLLMRGTTQTDFKHAVPKSAKELGPRINLTFRAITASAAAKPA